MFSVWAVNFVKLPLSFLLGLLAAKLNTINNKLIVAILMVMFAGN
jgi:hypothetical protein